VHIGTIDASRRRQIGATVGAQRGQCLQVVAQHLGGNILHNRQLRQARDVLQVNAMLEPLESLLDAPALVVQVTRVRHFDPICRPRWDAGVIQIKHLHALKSAVSQFLCSANIRTTCSFHVLLDALYSSACSSKSPPPAVTAMRGWWSPFATRMANPASARWPRSDALTSAVDSLTRC